MEAKRFASYVDELRDFARDYRMPVGSPEDLRGFRNALDGPGPFREECVSMLRSVVYRERGKVPTEELLALVALAWGGPEVDDRAEALQETLSNIQIFLVGVMRAPRDNPTLGPNYLSEVAITEPVADYGYAPKRSLGMFAAAAQTADDRVEASAIPQAAVEDTLEVSKSGVEATLKALELESPDVRLYLDLLKQKVDKEPPHEMVPASVVLDERSVLPAAAAVPSVREDPWDEHSELQKELRRFAAERKARDARYRAAKAALAPHIKMLLAIEDVVFRLVGSNNFVHRYLSRHLQLLGPDHWRG